ncbi:SufD family Fe-S cluster assembly protein [Denitrobacterium detoxificans]|jgi:Fe-S cluster assembly scaffold protein SufB|uniref:SufB/SufD family protein n=1 Tax=Denitrobacterium detoxificans TaxID=79604 RepID=UPI0026ED9856|nr:SufD family Fe-S cluster assembly protein [Denitrobacterium detoxificans]MBE6466705.1 SufD family Fe-S cluster assembly protein [Denitrobacterium detoxificans]
MSEQTQEPTITLDRVNTPPAQTWNYLRANDISLTVPNRPRQGTTRADLPRLFGSVECGMGQAVTQWVESQAGDALYWEVRSGEDAEPIVIDVDAVKGDIVDAGVIVRAGAQANILIHHHGSTPIGGTSAVLLRVIAERGSQVRLREIVVGDGVGQRIESVGITCGSGAQVDARQFFLAAGTTAAGFAAALDGDASRIDLTARYLGVNHDTLDINHVVRQRGQRTKSNVLESGVLDDAARKSLRATIDLIHGAHGAEGSELESVLVLGDDVVNKTMPVILCDEDNVAGNHGASIGSVGPDQIRYLRNRGLSEREAEDLYVRALFDDALIAAEMDDVRSRVVARAKTVLGEGIVEGLIDFDDAQAKEA